MTIELAWIVVMAVALLAGILSGLPVMLVIAGVPTLIGLVAAAFGQFDLVYFQAVPQRVFGIMQNALLIAVPLFVLVGVLLDRSKQAERMLSNINRLFGGTRQGLALAVIVVSALIAASTGIIGATIVMLGTISLP
ncbi:MAG TPA: TRAP transporter large permease subunit, partial [Rhodobacterales bacterium]|nr:TRAP transporter large permease subunit [Rhodobacterales bacterium]